MLQVAWVTDMGSARSNLQAFAAVVVFCLIRKYPRPFWSEKFTPINSLLSPNVNIFFPYSTNQQVPQKVSSWRWKERTEVWRSWSAAFLRLTKPRSLQPPRMWWSGSDRVWTSPSWSNLDPTPHVSIRNMRVSIHGVMGHDAKGWHVFQFLTLSLASRWVSVSHLLNQLQLLLQELKVSYAVIVHCSLSAPSSMNKERLWMDGEGVVAPQ